MDAAHAVIGRGSRQRRRDDGQEEETENICKTGGTSLRCTKADSQRQAEEDCRVQEGRAQETGSQQSETENTAASHAGSQGDRKSTRLNSSHSQISYAVFCLKKKKLSDIDEHNAHHTSHNEQSPYEH